MQGAKPHLGGASNRPGPEMDGSKLDPFPIACFQCLRPDQAIVGQPFQAAGERGFPAPRSGPGDWKVAGTGRLESLPYTAGRHNENCRQVPISHYVSRFTFLDCPLDSAHVQTSTFARGADDRRLRQRRGRGYPG